MEDKKIACICNNEKRDIIQNEYAFDDHYTAHEINIGDIIITRKMFSNINEFNVINIKTFENNRNIDIAISINRAISYIYIFSRIIKNKIRKANERRKNYPIYIIYSKM